MKRTEKALRRLLAIKGELEELEENEIALYYRKKSNNSKQQ